MSGATAAIGASMAPMRSLRARLFLAWTLSLLACLLVAAMLRGLYLQSAGAQQERAAEAVAEGCEAIAERYAYYATGWPGPLPAAGSPEAAALRADLLGVIGIAIGGKGGLSGGLWQQGADAPLAATRPPGAGVRASIQAVVTAAADEGATGARLLDGDGTVFVQACPAGGPVPGLAAFAVAEVAATPGQQRLAFGVGGLFVLILTMTALLGWAAIAWSRRIGGIEAALAAQAPGGLPRLAPTGERDLDRIVAALNLAGQRLDASRAEAAALAERVAQSERLAALGRVAAGVAHEVRNPVAAMRLRAENGLAGDDARRRTALEAILAQVGRLERLTGELLTMTQQRVPAPALVNLREMLENCAADHRGAIAIDIEAAPATVILDAGLLHRALDDLLRNAIRHSPPDGRITLRAVVEAGRLVLVVSDQGPGVPPDLRATLFEPFVTGRSDGTGLGLAIAREMVEAMGGRIMLADDPGPGAHFRIEIPCPPP